MWGRPESSSQTNALLPIPVFSLLLLLLFSFPFAHPSYLPSSSFSNNDDAI